jgi:hypothetical protein
LLISAVSTYMLCLLWIPGYFLVMFKYFLEVRGYKMLWWSQTFWRFSLFYHFDLHAEMSNEVIRAYFSTHNLFLWRGHWTGKSINIRRLRKRIRRHKRFLWHYFSTCFSEFTLRKVFANSSLQGRIFERIHLKRGTLGHSFDEFRILEIFIKSIGSCLVFICFFILYKYCLREFSQFYEKLQISCDNLGFSLFWTYLDMYIMRKKLIQHWIRWHKLWW